MHSSIRPSILLVGEINFARQAWQKIEASHRVIQYDTGDRNDLLKKFERNEFDDFVAVCSSNQYNHLTGAFDDHLISRLPKTVRAICNIGSGVNSIDVESCTRHGITVTNTPLAGADAVADTTLFLILGAHRRAMSSLSRAKQGQWQRDTPVGRDIQGRTLGLYGFGSIASTVAERAKAFGMNVQYYTPTAKRNGYVTPDHHVEAGYRSVPFDELIKTSDVVSIHAPLTADTHHVFSRPEFEKMKRGVVFINTARGSLVDQQALIEAVQSDHIWAVGMDVFEEEPEVPEVIRNDERFFITPHVATKTEQARLQMEECMIQNLTAVLDQEELPDAVN